MSQEAINEYLRIELLNSLDDYIVLTKVIILSFEMIITYINWCVDFLIFVMGNTSYYVTWWRIVTAIAPEKEL